MAHEGLHEPEQILSAATRDMHRVLVSLQEGLGAVDWYRQRADGCQDAQLEAILLHNTRKEREHAAMIIEWLRRDNAGFNSQLRDYVFTDAPITEVEEQATDRTHTARRAVPA